MKSDNFTYRDSKGRWVLIHVFDNVIYDVNKREVIFRFSWSMIEKLSSKEKGNYQSYKLQNVLNFRSLYTVNLYEIFKRELRGKKECSFEIDLDELRMALDTDDKIYPVYYEFKRNVLQKSVDEINEYNVDINVSFSEKRKGRKTGVICFTIINKNIKEELQDEVAMDVEVRGVKNLIIEPSTNQPISDEEYLLLLNKVDGDANKLYSIYGDCIKRIGNIRSIVAVIRDIIDNPDKYKNNKEQQISVFNNFEQRVYDYDVLEKRLLGWDK
jgi:plasmid replication initiation protein